MKYLILYLSLIFCCHSKTIFYGPKNDLAIKGHDPNFQSSTTSMQFSSSTAEVFIKELVTLEKGGVFNDITTPSTPVSGKTKVYSKNGEIFQLDSSGNETKLTTPTALVSSTSELTSAGGSVVLSATSSGSHTFTFPSASGADGEVLTADGSGGHTYSAPAGVTTQWYKGSGNNGLFGAVSTKIPYFLFSSSTGSGLFTVATSTDIGTEVTFNQSDLEVTACISWASGASGSTSYGISLNATDPSTSIYSQGLDEALCFDSMASGGAVVGGGCCTTVFPAQNDVLRPHAVSAQGPGSNSKGYFNITARQR